MYRKLIMAVCLGASIASLNVHAAQIWSETYQVPVTAELKPTIETPPSTAACVPGNPTSILYGGQWYPGKVLQGPDKNGTCLVSYDGYGSNWDEWVSPQRMRPAGNSNNKQPPQVTKPQSPAQIPTGKYNCYTFDAGQLNYTYTDLIIETATRYSVGKATGSYQFTPPDKITFTGTLANAGGSFSVKNTGKAQIDLVFKNDPRASMACVRVGK